MTMTALPAFIPRFVGRCLLCLGLTLAPLLPPFDASPLGQGMSAWADDDDDDDDRGDDDDDDHPRPRRAAPPPPPREVLAVGLSPAQLAELRQRGYAVLGQRPNGLLGDTVTLLRAPRQTRRDPLAEVRALGPNVWADRNPVYRLQQPRSGCRGADCANTSAPDPAWPLAQVAWPAPQARCLAGRPVIGLIDTAVDTQHPALRGAAIRTLTLPDAPDAPRRTPADGAHGTAVAALLVGRGAETGLPPLLPRARVVAVNAFHRSGNGAQAQERMDAWDLVAALDAVVGAGAQVLNMSFAGPANRLLEEGLQRARQRGVVPVAAVGNAGPRAAPQYPAAYEGVIGVTAVGADGRVFHRAGRGRHVDLAAPGVQLPTAGTPAGAPVLRSGTSFAAPFVSAAAAALVAQGIPAEAVALRLTSQVRDLGTRGHDTTFGHGLLQLTPLCEARLRP